MAAQLAAPMVYYSVERWAASTDAKRVVCLVGYLVAQKADRKAGRKAAPKVLTKVGV